MEAFGGPDRTKFIEAYEKEVKSILQHTATPIPEGHEEYETAVKEATSSRLIFNEKRDGRKKCRWVVQGCFESTALDDWTNYAHVATLDAVRTLIFRRDRHLRTLASVDIKTAFLQSKPYEKCEKARYIKLRDPFTGKVHYYRLITPMYGQRSAPRRWEDTLAPWLEAQGFNRGKNEQCVFYRESDDLTLLVYVDDILIDGDDAAVRAFLPALMNEFDCNNPVFLTLDTPIDFIGMIIELFTDRIEVTMEPYCDKLLKSMSMEDCTPRGVPFKYDLDYESELLDDKLASLYRTGVGGIGWLVSTMRPDLGFAFSQLGAYLSKPTVSTLGALKRALRYIQGTKHYRLSMKFDLCDLCDLCDLANTYHLSTDSDHGGNPDPNAKRKSQSGHIATQNGVPMSWKSQGQSVTANSSAESEIYAASLALENFMHYSYVVSELGYTDFPSPFPLHIDNAACIIFMQDSSRVSKLKHIDRRWNWVQQMRNSSVVVPTKIGTDDNLSDILTKPLEAPKLKHFCDLLFNTNK